MKPAFSVIFLTTLIGAGQGLLIALVGTQILAGGVERSFYALGAALVLALLGLGLVASVFHLANPQRGWRAATRWRTSWLSREVILIPVLFGLVLLYAGVNVLDILPHAARPALGLAAALVALALFVATGMIYACVRFIPQWASAWTVVNYLLMGLASGFTLAAAYAAMRDAAPAGVLSWSAVLLTLAALSTRTFQLWRNAVAPAGPGLKTAIGVHHTQIRQVTQGFMGSSFNTVEFRAPGTAESLRGLTAFFLIAGFVGPAFLLMAGLPALAFLCQFVGLLAERWVFFAAGTHVQNLYYQAKA